MTTEAVRPRADMRVLPNTRMQRRRMRRGLCALLVSLCGCAVQAPPSPRALDCNTLDRAAERFPDECGEAEEDAAAEDASIEAGETSDAGQPFDAGERFDALP